MEQRQIRMAELRFPVHVIPYAFAHENFVVVNALVTLDPISAPTSMLIWKAKGSNRMSSPSA